MSSLFHSISKTAPGNSPVFNGEESPIGQQSFLQEHRDSEARRDAGRTESAQVRQSGLKSNRLYAAAEENESSPFSDGLSSQDEKLPFHGLSFLA